MFYEIITHNFEMGDRFPRPCQPPEPNRQISKPAGTIDLPNKSNKGELGDVEYCPSGSYVSSVRLRVKRVKGGDKTGVNGVEMQCHTKEGESTEMKKF